MSNVFNLARAESLKMLGDLTNEELIRMATAAVANGCDSEAVFHLSICTVDETDEINVQFAKLKEEHGGENMSMLEALRHYAKETSVSILLGTVSPSDGAKMISRASLKARLADFHELDGFLYAASEIDDRPDDKALFEAGILEEAKRAATAT